MKLRIEPEYWFGGNIRAGLSSWLDVRADEWLLPAHAQKEITLHLKTPEGLRGECMVMLFFAHEPTGEVLQIKTRIGIPLYVRQRGTGRVRGKIEQFRPDHRAEGRSGFFIEVKNTGNLHILPIGTVTLKSEKTGRSYQINVKYEEPIFPGQTVPLQVGVDEPLPKDQYRAELQLVLNTLYQSPEPGEKLVLISRQCGWPQAR